MSSTSSGGVAGRETGLQRLETPYVENMAGAAEKIFGLKQPSSQHGATANDRFDEKFDTNFEPPSEPSDQGNLALESRYGEPKEPRLEALRSVTSHPLERTESGVDIEKAQKEFADLGRELSQHSRRMSRQNSRASARRPRSKAGDVEKAISPSESSYDESWDLEETLRGNRNADQEAGIKSKRIGMLLR